MVLIGFAVLIGYCLLIGLENRNLAKLLLSVGVVLMLQATMEDLTPVLKRWSERVDSLQNTADRVVNIGQGSFESPMKGEITQLFKGNLHHGIDIGANEGTSVKASREGDVSYVGWHDIYGNMVIVDHGKGMQTVYAHLSGLSVKVGYPVLEGDQIGSCGNTGRSSGPHLHFEIRKNGTSLDPMSFLN